MLNGNATNEPVQIGDWTFSPDRRELQCAQTCRHLDPRDVQVLGHLVEMAPEVVSVESLLARNWAGMVVGDNALHRVIARLRRAFADDRHQPRYIQTIAKSGYRLVARIGSGVPRRRALVAVLPLQPITSGEETRTLAAGLDIEIRGTLARSGVVGVTLDASPPPAATDLTFHVHQLLTGSVRVHARHMRTQLELVDTDTAELVWTASWDATLGDAIDIAVQVAQEVERALVPLLVSRHRQRENGDNDVLAL